MKFDAKTVTGWLGLVAFYITQRPQVIGFLSEPWRGSVWEACGLLVWLCAAGYVSLPRRQEPSSSPPSPIPPK